MAWQKATWAKCATALIVAVLLGSPAVNGGYTDEGAQGDRHPAGVPSLQQALDMGSTFPRPPHEDAAQMARWVVHLTNWGALATLGVPSTKLAIAVDGADVGVIPVSGVVSHSDGAPATPLGRLFFYLTPMDELVRNLEKNPAVSFTVTEAQMMPHGCIASADPEDPTCAKVTFLGSMARVPSEELQLARDAMFARHPTMASWPPTHKFTMYELRISSVHVLDFYGGMKVLDAEEYFAAELKMQPLSNHRVANFHSNDNRKDAAAL